MTLAYLAAAWTIGIALAAAFTLPATFWLWLLILPAGGLLLSRGHPARRQMHLLLLMLLLGAVRYQLALPSPKDRALAAFNDQGSAALIGIVYDDPVPGDRYIQFRVQVSRINRDKSWEDISGRVLVRAPRDLPVRYGDEVRVEGELTTPPDGADFSYRDFLARDAVLSELRAQRATVMMHDMGDPLFASLYAFRAAALVAIRTLFPEPAAALLSGILLGRDEGIPDALSTAFKSTNTGHIIAISGFNIAIIAGLLGRFAKRLPGWLGGMLVVGVLVLYTLLVGASASVARAAVMGILVVVAERLGRQAWALISLAASAIVMTLLNPFTLWDLGFQLSFLATLGLVLYADPLQAQVEQLLTRVIGSTRARSVARFLSDSVIVTLAAWITTTPLLIAVFHRLSLIGLLTNLLVLPIQPHVMILSGLATIVQLAAGAVATVPVASVILGGCAHVLAAVGYLFTQYTILVVEWTARVPFAAIETPRIDFLLAALAYLALFALPRVPLRTLPRWLVATPERLAGGLAITIVIAWSILLARPDPRTHIQFIATDGGDAVFIQTANGGRILVDGSAEPSALLGHLGEQTTFWDRRIDLLVLTHLDENNVSSLNAVLDRYDVGQVLEPRPPAGKGGPSYRQWRQLLADKGICLTVAEEQVHVQVDEVGIEVLAPVAGGKGTNVALRLTAGNQRVVLAPSLAAADFDDVAVSDTDWSADFAALPSKVDPTLLHKIDPATAILFVGRGAREQPASESLQLLDGRNVLRTDERGDVEVIVNGEKVEVRTER